MRRESHNKTPAGNWSAPQTNKARKPRVPAPKHSTGAKERRYRYEQLAVTMLDEAFGPCDAKRTMTIDLRTIGRVNMAALERASARSLNRPPRSLHKTISPAFQRRVEFDWIRRPRDGQKGIVVEVDGAQHERPVARFGGTTQFVHRVESDFDKDRWARANGYIVERVSNTAFGDSRSMCGKDVFANRMRNLIASVRAQLGTRDSAQSCARQMRPRFEMHGAADDNSDVSVEQPDWPGCA